VLRSLQQLHECLVLLPLNRLDHAVLQLFAIFVQNFESVAKVIKHTTKQAEAISADKFDVVLAAYVINSKVGSFRLLA